MIKTYIVTWNNVVSGLDDITNQIDNYDYMMKGGSAVQDFAQSMGPVAANALLGGSFGSF
jgi:hypothetical protein